MSSSGSSSATSHRNNFDLLRFVFAFIVFLYHAHVLSGRPELAGLSRWLSAEFAVESFFVVSGFLVFMSYENSASIRDYFSKRARRVYPAYFAVVAAAALGGVFITSLSPGEYFSGAWIRYLAANLAFLNFLAPELPGLFQGNPWHAVNGALWTLKIEVMFYLAVPVIAFICIRLGRWQTFAALYVLSVAYALGMEHLFRESGRDLYAQLGRQLPGQLSYFLAGAACYYFLDSFARHWRWAFPVALAALLIPLPRPVDVAVEPAALGVLVAYLAVGARFLGNFGRYGDFSYGIYIVHFPVLQVLVGYGLFDVNAFLGLGVTTAIVLGAALASWHLVEKPFLRKSSHYVVAEQSPRQA